MSTESFETTSEQETAAIGERLAASVEPGTVVLLHGDLGAGKTAFVRGLARGLGAAPDEVTSPTFTLIQEYRGRIPLYHADLYRLAPREVEELALDELAADGVLAVEWAERWADRPPLAHVVTIQDAGGDLRRVNVARPG